MGQFTVNIGETVCYSRTFGRSVGLDGYAMNARGTVTGLSRLGGETILAEIDWHGANLPTRVNVQNLAHPGPNIRFAD